MAVQPTATPTRVLPTATPVAEGKVVYGGTLNYVIGGDVLRSLDPHYSVDPGDNRPLFQIFDTIVELGANGELLPSLARSWDILEGGKVITFRLQQGVKFQDGTDFNADAVKFNFDRMFDPKEISPRKSDFGDIVESINVVDQNTLSLRLKNAFRPIVAVLADRSGMIVSPAGAKKYGRDFAANPVGTGPFTLAEWKFDARVTLKKNANYWNKGLPYIDAIQMPVAHDSAVRVAMLRTQEVDIMPGTGIRAEEVPILKANPNLKVFRYEGAGTTMLHFNVQKQPYTNKVLRQAIAYSMDRETFVKVQFQGAAKAAYTLIADGWAYNDSLKPFAYNLSKVKEKLAEAGYSPGTTLPFGCRTDTFYLQQCELAQSMMQAAGIRVEIALMDPGIYTRADRGYSGVQGLGLVYWFHRADPHILNNWLYHTEGFVNAARGKYSNPGLDKLIDEAAAVYDIAKAKELYDKIQLTAAEDVPLVTLVYPATFVATNKRVGGFIRRPDNWERFKTVWLQK